MASLVDELAVQHGTEQATPEVGAPNCADHLLLWHWLLLITIALAPIAAALIVIYAHRLRRSADSNTSDDSEQLVALVRILDEAQVADTKVRLRVSVFTFATGWIILVFCDQVYPHVCALVAPSTTGYKDTEYAAAPAYFLIILSCRPTDRLGIRCACLLGTVRMLLACFQAYLISAEIINVQAADWDKCSSYTLSVTSTRAVLNLCYSLFLASSLLLPARQALQRLWLVFRILFLIGMLKFALGWFLGCLSDGPGMVHTTRAQFYYYGFGIPFALLLTARNRGRVHYLLGSLGLDERVRRASAVAALFGGRDGFRSTRSRVLDAASRFKAVRLSALSIEVLSNATASEDERALLNSYAEHASLGGVVHHLPSRRTLIASAPSLVDPLYS